MKSTRVQENSSDTITSSEQETSYTIDEEGTIIPKLIDREENGLSVNQYSDLPITKKTQKIENIQMLIVVVEQGFKSPTYNEDFVVDLEGEKMYLYPSISSIRNTLPDWQLNKEDIMKLQNLITKYKIQDWESTYGERTVESVPEGVAISDDTGSYYWKVLIVYKDETISKSEGYESMEQFNQFHQELMDFRDEQREKWLETIEE